MKVRGSKLLTSVRSIAGWRGAVFGVASDNRAYTIAEVMIVLAVTAGMFVMVMASFSGRQAKAEFATAARDMESRLQDIANDVSTGYYDNPGNISCTVNAQYKPEVSEVNNNPNEQGTNKDCTFIGKVIHFISGDNRRYDVYTVVGSRQNSGGADAGSLGEANPTASTYLMESVQLPVGLVMSSVKSGGYAKSAVGFFTTFGARSGGERSLSVNTVPFGGDNVLLAVADINDSTTMNPPGGIIICMDGDAVKQYAVLKLGGNNSRLTTDVTIKDGKCAEL